LYDASLVALLPGVEDACGALSALGLALVVVTNQGSVARGAARLEDVEGVNRRLCELLPTVDAVYYCPFHPQGGGGVFTREHPWRKPNPGMLHAAAATLGLDLAGSFLIGDATRDIDAGVAAGLRRERCFLLAPEGPWTFAKAAEAIACDVRGT
jgi:histidinol-phosphate phosphatase family protein